MPAPVLHKLHAEIVLKDIERKNNIRVYKPAFLYGAQGPDFFFTHRILPWMKGEKIAEFGGMFHKTEPLLMLENMREYLTENSSIELASYFFGFICHYSLDSVCHPYINATARELLELEPKQSLSVMHADIEAALEAIVYGEKTSELASELDLGECYPLDETTQDLIVGLYKFLIKKLFNRDVHEFLIFQATEDAHNVRKMMNDKTGIKRNLMLALEFGRKRTISSNFIPVKYIDEYDWANAGHAIWVDDQGNERSQSFKNLFSVSLQKAKSIINGLSKNKLSELVDNEPF